MTISGCSRCFNGACPEVVPVTIEQNSYALTLPGTLKCEQTALSGTAARYIAYLADADGDPILDVFAIRFRIVDDKANADLPTTFAPTQPGWSEAVVHTDETLGYAEVNLGYSNGGSKRTWGVVAELGGIVAVADDLAQLG